MIDTSKWRIEYRTRGQRNYSSYGWMVVVNKKTGKVLCDPNFPRAHKTFQDSDEIDKYLKSIERRATV